MVINSRAYSKNLQFRPLTGEKIQKFYKIVPLRGVKLQLSQAVMAMMWDYQCCRLDRHMWRDRMREEGSEEG